MAMTIGLAGVAGCGDDVPTKADFVERLRADTNVDRAVAECAYDRIADDHHLMEEAMTKSDTGDQKLAPKDHQRLTQIMARCVLATATTTTTEGR
jgi:hypothetical protein